MVGVSVGLVLFVCFGVLAFSVGLVLFFFFNLVSCQQLRGLILGSHI